jgi:hypothetical protein
VTAAAKSCDEAARLCESMGYRQRAAELRARVQELRRGDE